MWPWCADPREKTAPRMSRKRERESDATDDIHEDPAPKRLSTALACLQRACEQIKKICTDDIPCAPYDELVEMKACIAAMPCDSVMPALRNAISSALVRDMDWMRLSNEVWANVIRSQRATYVLGAVNRRLRVLVRAFWPFSARFPRGCSGFQLDTRLVYDPQYPRFEAVRCLTVQPRLNGTDMRQWTSGLDAFISMFPRLDSLCVDLSYTNVMMQVKLGELVAPKAKINAPASFSCNAVHCSEYSSNLLDMFDTSNVRHMLFAPSSYSNAKDCQSLITLDVCESGSLPLVRLPSDRRLESIVISMYHTIDRHSDELLRYYMRMTDVIVIAESLPSKIMALPRGHPLDPFPLACNSIASRLCPGQRYFVSFRLFVRMKLAKAKHLGWFIQQMPRVDLLVNPSDMCVFLKCMKSSMKTSTKLRVYSATLDLGRVCGLKLLCDFEATVDPLLRKSSLEA